MTKITKATPDLMGDLKQRGPRQPRKPKPRTAEQIAASMEAEGKKWLDLAAVLRGKSKIERE